MFGGDFLVDGVTVTYWLAGVLMIALAAWCGHRTGTERPGRFYATLLLFAAGYGITAASGSLKLLFAGWEITGMASFLLMVAHRNLTAGNSAKALFIYRLGDVGLLLAMWASHHLWRDHAAIVSLLLVATASAQASQLPFSSWLPQAVENSGLASMLVLCTLTVQMGALLLLRSAPMWENQLLIRVLMAALGVLAAVLAAGFARVQPSLKARIAYSAMTQAGLIFIEVAAGLRTLALVHMAANTLWQAYRVWDLSRPRTSLPPVRAARNTWEDLLPNKLKYSLYTMYFKEWGLYAGLSKYLRT